MNAFDCCRHRRPSSAYLGWLFAVGTGLLGSCGGDDSGGVSVDGGSDSGGDASATSPTIVAIDPAVGLVAGDTLVTIDGTNLTDGAGETTVEFDGVAAVVESARATQLEVTTPPGSGPGAVVVSVTNSLGTVSVSDGFAYECAAAQDECSGRCVDLLVDSRDCGICGTECGDGVGCFAGTCTTPAQLPEGRWRGTAALGGDGRIYFVGGRNFTQRVADVYAFDPRTNMWTTVASLPTTLSLAAAAATDNGDLVVVGGIRQNVAGAETLRYSIADDAWTEVASMQTARSFFDAATVGGLVYATGVSPPEPTVERYDVLADSWAPVASMPEGRSSMLTVSANGLLFAIGGFDANFDRTNTVYIYDPANDQWAASGGLMPTPRVPSGAVGGDGRVYAFGDKENRTITVGASFDPVLGTWLAAPDLPTGRRDPASAAGDDGRVYIIGGAGANVTIGGTTAPEPLTVVEVYDPFTGRWATAP